MPTPALPKMKLKRHFKQKSSTFFLFFTHLILKLSLKLISTFVLQEGASAERISRVSVECVTDTPVRTSEEVQLNRLVGLMKSPDT